MEFAFTSIPLFLSHNLCRCSYFSQVAHSPPPAPAHVHNKAINSDPQQPRTFHTWSGINRAFINRLYFSGGLSCLKAAKDELNAANRLKSDLHLHGLTGSSAFIFICDGDTWKGAQTIVMPIFLFMELVKVSPFASYKVQNGFIYL